MRYAVLLLIAATALSSMTSAPAAALPATAPGMSASSDALSLSEQARIYCYNRSSGEFLHWGACRSHPRVYCRNTYTGEFLHWGSCY